MIFLTVGTHEPFDRLVKAVDEWCAARHFEGLVFGQVTDRAKYLPTSFPWVPSLAPNIYRDHCRQASVMVAHAGMGSIITAMSIGKPLVIMPRRGHLGETRNDHQYDTARRFGDRPGIYSAMSEAELPTVLDRAMSFGSDLDPAVPLSAEESMIDAVRGFLLGTRPD